MMRRILLSLVALLGAVTMFGQRPAAVDLGLPSGVKWGSFNLGADKPSGIGNFYAWGETKPKDVYDWSSYKWSQGSSQTLTKYVNDDSYTGPVDDKYVLDPEDDAARAALGGKWRTPTRSEFIELRRECVWTWTSVDGMAGYEVKSKVNGNSIFIPAVGFWQDNKPVGVGAGIFGDYWTASLGGACPEYAFNVTFNSTVLDWGTFERTYGFSIRPVTD